MMDGVNLGATYVRACRSRSQPHLRDVAPSTADERRDTIRIATWNIHAARDAPLNEIVDELREIDADILALQEVDHRAARTGYVNQPKAMADALSFHYAFAASIRIPGGDYGLALLSRWPLADVVRHRLHTAQPGEPRIVLETLVCAAGRPLWLFNHHADTAPAARRSNLAALEQIVRRRRGSAMIVLGDFNDTPNESGIRALIDAGLVDPAAKWNPRTAGEGRIDYLLVDGSLATSVRQTRVWKSRKSDHHALVVDIGW
jgi:endonuclease/exonuclease/phosphatase family metal-dependent hydrolase